MTIDELRAEIERKMGLLEKSDHIVGGMQGVARSVMIDTLGWVLSLIEKGE